MQLYWRQNDDDTKEAEFDPLYCSDKLSRHGLFGSCQDAHLSFLLRLLLTMPPEATPKFR
ncbi:unnamed protein product [Urochloa humidicola]